MASAIAVVRVEQTGIKCSTTLTDDLQARIRELTKLAKEQGYVTFDDLNEALPAGITDADELDAYDQ